MNTDGYVHPVIECGYLDPDTMIAHNSKVNFDVMHAGMTLYAGRGRWQNIFGERVPEPDPNDTEAWLARRAADRRRIPPYLESPRVCRARLCDCVIG